MAQTDRFMIAPLNSGLQKNLKPWMIPDDSFESLRNAYIFRGRIKKRFGSYYMNQSVDYLTGQLYSRLRANIGVTPGPINIPGTATQLQIGQAFSVGTDIFTVHQLGAGVTTLSTNGAITCTIDSVANPNTVTFVGATPATDVYYYPASPVMGFADYQSPNVNDEPMYVFDTQFAYQYINDAFERLANEDTTGASVWTGDDSQFFWSSTYRGITNADYYLFVTNFNQPDRIRYWDGTHPLAVDNKWYKISPVIDGTFRLHSARLIVPFKDRVVCFNTIENNEGVSIGTSNATTGNFGPVVAPGGVYKKGQSFVVGSTVFTVISDLPGAQPMAYSNAILPLKATAPTGTFDVTTGTVNITGNGTNPGQTVYFLDDTTGTSFSYVNRCRFSLNGNPVAGDGFQQYVGKGGYIDAPTKEEIITCEFLKDRLIVYFERSTWELVYTANQILPFTWQKINTELGAEATFSVVPFDKVVLGVGNVGIHACNGSNVERVDDKIPNDVYEIRNSGDGVKRVYGIRDYFAECVYWTFPQSNKDATYPNRVLVYNYATGSWAYNDDSFTAFGYFQRQPNMTWSSARRTWAEATNTWSSGTIQSNFRQIVAGNQEGFVTIIDTETGRNAQALQITNITLTDNNKVAITCINHNLTTDSDYILIKSAQGVTGLNDLVYQVYLVVDADTFIILNENITGTYTGGGTIARVSQIDILTKQYNFYVDQGVNSMINKVDFLVDKTYSGEVSVDYFVSSSSVSQLSSGQASDALLGTGVLETRAYDLVPYEETQSRLWHPIYPMADGECIQLRIYLNDAQLKDTDIAFAGFELNAMTFFTQRSASRLQ